jgi:hypothetical protein
LTIDSSGLKYPTIAVGFEACGDFFMNIGQPLNTTYNYPQSDAMDKQCRHPRVQVVSRDEDAEYVECIECREVFESSEFRDMDIESKIPTEEE